MTEAEQKMLVEFILTIVKETGLEVFDMAVKPYRGVANIELTVDHPDGGILIDECADLNRKIVEAIEHVEIYGDDYTVAVSSPGLDRPLKEAKDFQRVMGSEIEVAYRDQDAGKILQDYGEIKKVSDDSVVLETDKGEVVILFEHIQNAVVMI